jgi:C-terminal processing protease CtpA/Prc
MKSSSRLFLSALLLSLLVALPAFAGSKARLGFGTEATISGFFSPKLKRVRVTEVVPGSPAARAGLLTGDQVMQANGQEIAGAPARAMAKALREVAPGQHLRMRVRRADGSLHDVDIVAGNAE